MCPIAYREEGSGYGPPAFIAYDLFRQIVEQLPECTELQLQGLGEPLLHPQFFDMVEYASSRGITVSTNTNLTLLTLERARRIVSCGLSRLHVSIDGATAQTYEHIRIRANFRKVRRNLERLMSARHCAPASNLAVHVVFVVMRQNLEELEQVVNLAGELGIKAMEVQHLCHDFGEETLPERYAPMRRFVMEQTLAGESALAKRYFDAARVAALRYGMQLRLPNLEPRIHAADVPGRARCSWPWTGAYYSFKGDAMPCCMIATPDRGTFGNVTADSVEAVWNGSAAERFRSQLDSSTPPAVCQSCSVYNGTF